jgi:opacity protein-like surface antigen
MTVVNLKAMSPKHRDCRFIGLVHYHEVGLKGRNRFNFERKLSSNNVRLGIAYKF